MALINKLNAIGNAIRAKTGKSELLSLDDMVTEIGSISGDSGITIGNVNIASADGIINNMYIDGNGAETAYNNWSISDYIPVRPGVKYTVSPISIFGQLQYSGLYDENKQYLGMVTDSYYASKQLSLLTFGSDVKYVRFSSGTANINNLQVYEITGDIIEL